MFLSLRAFVDRKQVPGRISAAAAYDFEAAQMIAAADGNLHEM